MKTINLFLLPSFLFISLGLAETQPISIKSQDAFFANISKLCGKAFAGKVVADNSDSDSFADKKLVMHVRKCSADQIQIPFHVGDDSSRTFILTRTDLGISLKHDHRHKDGTSDVLTMYGGSTVDAGWAEVQSFPADQYSKDLFVKEGIPQSIRNIWQMYVYPEFFSYRLIREGRVFRVDFDLTKPVKAPAAPWGYID